MIDTQRESCDDLVMSFPYAFLALAAIATALPAPAQTPTYNDVPWATVDTFSGPATLRMDLYKPTTSSFATPVVLFVRGGGWANGSHDNWLGFFQGLLDQGVAVASMGYRSTSQAVFPAQIHDVKGAVRWLRANGSTYGLATCRIGVWGTSAGGHLASLLGTTIGNVALEGTTGGAPSGISSSVDAVVSYYAPSDLYELQPDFTIPTPTDYDAPGSPLSKLIGFPPGVGVIRANPGLYPAEIALLALGSPAAHAKAHLAPHADFFIGHSALDETVPVRQSRRLHGALLGVGASSTLRIVPGFHHHGGLDPVVDADAVTFLVSRIAGTCP